MEDVIKRIDHKSIFPIVGKSAIPAYGMLRTKEQTDLLQKIAPLCEEDIKQLKDAGYEFPNEWQENNTILIRNPFRPYQLVLADTDQNTLISGHLHDIAAIFRALGATSCKENASIVSKEEITFSGKGKLKIKTTNIFGRLYFKAVNKKEQHIQLEIKANEKTCSREEKYNDAKSYAQKYHIEEVPKIQEVLRAFDPIIRSDDKSYTFDEDLTTDLHALFKGAIKVSTTGLFSLKGDMSYESKSYNNLHIHKEISFTKDPHSDK